MQTDPFELYLSEIVARPYRCKVTLSSSYAFVSSNSGNTFTANTVTVPNAAWQATPSGQWVGYTVATINGFNALNVASNTANVLTGVGNWSAGSTPVANTQIAILAYAIGGAGGSAYGVVPFDTVITDPCGNWVPTSPTISQVNWGLIQPGWNQGGAGYVVPVDGCYLVIFNAMTTTSIQATCQYVPQIHQNGVLVSTARRLSQTSGANWGQTNHILLKCTAGDFIQAGYFVGGIQPNTLFNENYNGSNQRVTAFGDQSVNFMDIWYMGSA